MELQISCCPKAAQYRRHCSCNEVTWSCGQE